MVRITGFDKNKSFMLIDAYEEDSKPSECYARRNLFIAQLRKDYKDSSEKEELFNWDEENDIPYLEELDGSADLEASQLVLNLATLLEGSVYFLNSHDLYACCWVIVY